MLRSAATSAGSAQPEVGRTLDGRITALDGFRGLLTLMVVFSHYFGELPNGLRGMMFGWVAVIGFYVLSGFLIGRLILEKQVHQNFMAVFYVRRFCRMMPACFVVLIAIFAIYAAIGHHEWTNIGEAFPFWTYATFTQNFYMIHAGHIGPHWLAPTWTLAIEEHFYLIAPTAILLTPRRYLLPGLIALAVVSLGFRILVFHFELWSPLTGRVLLLSVADTLIAGLIAAALIKTDGIGWERYDVALRVTPLVALLAAGLCQAAGGAAWFATFGTTFLAIGMAAFILGLVRGVPEARRFESPVLSFFGHMSYCIYLTHLAVLGLMHGVLLGARPDLASWEQFGVSLLTLPVAVGVAWVLYKIAEEPGLNYGRRWTWSKALRQPKAGRVSTPATSGTAA